MIHSAINLRGNPLFASDKNSDIIKYSVVLFIWSKNLDTTLIFDIPPHILMMSVPEILK